MDSQRKQPSKPYNIAYTFLFENRSPETIALRLARETLDLIEEKHFAPSAWVELEYCMCEDCPLDPATVKYCPVALNLSDVVERFQNFFAYENVHVTVTTEERTYSKETTVQTGLSSLIGIIMTTSGCPVLKYLKPMVRFHLPFASIEETI